VGMKPQKIRPLAICVFRHEDRILVAEGRDEIKDETFYRPLGGAIEFGEYARDTLVRELREEIGAEIGDLQYLGALENVFAYMGNKDTKSCSSSTERLWTAPSTARNASTGTRMG